MPSGAQITRNKPSGRRLYVISDKVYYIITSFVPANFSINRLVQTPALRSPQSNLLTTNKLPTFSWNGVTGGKSYEIMFATNSTFANIVDSKIVSGSTHTVTAPFSDGKYFWRVRAYDASNQFGKWSSARYYHDRYHWTLSPSVKFPQRIMHTRAGPLSNG